jgi:hypothetical protein
MNAARRPLIRLRSSKKGSAHLTLRLKIPADTAREVVAILANSVPSAEMLSAMDWHYGRYKLLH